MRTVKNVLAFAAIAASLCSCGSQNKDTSSADTASEKNVSVSDENSPSSESGFDVDLTELNSSMVYAQVYDMVANPDDYMGKSIRVKGPFSYFKDSQTGNEYFAVLVSDATACCSQGIEFVLDGDPKYPDDYPKLDTNITVSGEFNYYKEGVNIYCQLLHAEIEDSPLSWK
ncbi:hypothetical protein [Ruminococcus flavefaciens]|uniref:hypothetical protein n=1 Tax=Ruminococcus flavefaciens TaxID=1265 RepID=UPI0026F09611|nr:hypothetical protein [Ruminococcus flavefaciens]MDD7518203.1 hypothetical protein [Ruminococcus flavefaciens]MDY5690612.1 hypothetical protein [Ruminococcus flavefaciens]